ncbi:MAG: hypothetical protein CO162_07285 [bacterium (Candidatus Ratteibacteria) CG_4_9_14_3_um_filter_41_21]|uniref:protein acetyllysine N-acetyltransferase n=2 Tax=Candidatus Ratteibacteria TaxID=2979319 RepID=A0A2M7YE34_9BACT|nr:MAG: hypothetical protein AUJ76_03335 [Candidatus Omnitrophica bacterium CG1_02_41_171]PIV64813.1 MAG: hypothetical protein COS11_00210 [bacterium (Candidatus Ratteibacteria) CG01_land_8_20_14_3_00_40_19]PIW73844.1 MAG: hypothetical protein CO004_03800 [bacterium (Candidatus Ratteibacteria) CG_4_8_14_3_um_filter_41_36]PIX89330.1 MAG: hypothetical protein COZ31_02595 [Nitrospirae bacterium CG_4_10_14_3_um_filter_44_29]PJA61254.1 MAG: hypothetical protein CO162_07285 [bacterium (Candidatus Rat
MSSRLAIIKNFLRFFRCSCGGRIRPSIVFFGEILPESQFLKAEKMVLNCDLLLLIGTSGIVQPAPNLPSLAKETGVRIIET